jgi:protein gp37
MAFGSSAPTIEVSCQDQCARFFIKGWGGQNQEAGRELDGDTWYDVPKSR